MNTPFIVINGDKGKSCTVKYLTYILHSLYKIDILNYEYDEDTKIITNIIINDKFTINLNDSRKDLINLEGDENINLLNYITLKYNVKFVVCKYNSLIQYFKVILCGLTTIEYNINTLDLYKNIENLTQNSVGFLRVNVPLVTCLHSKDFMYKLFNICNTYIVPIFLTNFYHLKYINYNTQIKSRYSYINTAIALVITQILNQTFELEKKTLIDLDRKLDYSKYKMIEYDVYRPLFCRYVSPLPNLNNINFNYNYNFVKKINENLTFYLDSGGTYKSSNLALNWFNNKNEKDTNICIFNVSPEQDLIKTLLPITNINLNTLFIVDYKVNGKTIEDLLDIFDGIVKDTQDYKEDWSETCYNMTNYLYTDVNFQYARIKSSLPINEYEGLEEIKNVSEEEISKICLPVMPSIIVDDVESIVEWITMLQKNNEGCNFRILVTGCKKLTKDVYELI
jgi:hypothetical protein